MPHFSLKVLAMSQTIIGRFFRSLKVGRITEYLAPLPLVGVEIGDISRSGVIRWLNVGELCLSRKLLAGRDGEGGCA